MAPPRLRLRAESRAAEHRLQDSGPGRLRAGRTAGSSTGQAAPPRTPRRHRSARGGGGRGSIGVHLGWAPREALWLGTGGASRYLAPDAHAGRLAELSPGTFGRRAPPAAPGTKQTGAPRRARITARAPRGAPAPAGSPRGDPPGNLPRQSPAAIPRGNPPRQSPAAIPRGNTPRIRGGRINRGRLAAPARGLRRETAHRPVVVSGGGSQ